MKPRLPRIWSIVVGILLVCAFSLIAGSSNAATGTQMAAPATTAGNYIGTWGIMSSDSSAFTAFQNAGAQWARVAISWSSVEASPGSYSWSIWDSRLKQMRNKGYNIILAVVSNPSWAADYECGPIYANRLDEFAAFLKALVARYSVAPYNVSYIELGNEPDNGDVINHAWVGGCWGIGPNPAPGAGGYAYSKMLKVAYPAIKSANANVKVAIGGLSYESWTTDGGPFDPNFLTDVLASGGGNYFDVINYHFYEAFSYRWGSLAAKGLQLQSIVRSYTGQTKPLMVTEFSTPSDKPAGSDDPNSYSEELQARYVMKGFAQGIAAGIYPLIWFQAVDRPENSGGYAYGLIRPNGQFKPGYYAFRTFATEVGYMSYKGKPPALDGRVEGYTFAGGGSEKSVVWTNGQTVNQAFSLASAGATLRVVDIYGNASFIVDGSSDDLDYSRNGQVTIEVGHSPLIVEPNYTGNQNITQSVPLTSGWSLFSYRVALSNTSLTSVLNSVNGTYTRVLGQDGTYDSSIPDSFNTLRDLVPEQGYWVFTKRNATLNVTGRPANTDSPISLDAGWNWIGYLPASPMPVAQALASISGAYTRVLGEDGTYDTSIPASFNTLKTLDPGAGYQIFMKRTANLTYPASAAAQSAVQVGAQTASNAEAAPAAPSGECPNPPPKRSTRNDVFGFVSPGASIGDTVTAISPRNDVVGCWVVEVANQYGVMAVYPEDTDNNIPGMRPGETVRFRVNGVLAQGTMTYSTDYQLVQVNLTLPTSPTNTPTPTQPSSGPDRHTHHDADESSYSHTHCVADESGYSHADSNPHATGHADTTS